MTLVRIGVSDIKIESQKVLEAVLVETNKRDFHLRDVIFFAKKLVTLPINFTKLKVVDLIAVEEIPLWLIDYVAAEGLMKIHSNALETEEFFQQLIMLCDFEHCKSIGLLVECDSRDRYMVIYPTLKSSNTVEIECLLLNFSNELNLKFITLSRLWKQQKLKAHPDKTIFVDIDTQIKKGNDFFDSYLKKRSSSATVSSASGIRPIGSSVIAPQACSSTSNDHQFIDKFNKLIEKYILNEYRLRSIYSRLPKHDYRELYSLIFKSTKFMLRSSQKSGEMPDPSILNNVLDRLFNLYLTVDEDTDLITENFS
ncbi:hypothetical protein CANARDRAFT_5888 [[Candida] arabinofermentans NRRL YB-2248]|uniref:Sld7 C-terminal domain-containing protein n=1 Tax=[Candida] arabinofermentans NRRL YB-2248 TaxID=983967 RepID=A0A1E4T6I7_9ASCO|nr:hypothetical protein CANARDRAFT_5888 [[Candida] arabinofermentans NRRL YB-2248]